MDLHLEDAHVDVIRDLLSTTLSDLSYEISDTDNPGYKRRLEERRTVLREVLDKLGGPVATS